MKLTDLVKQFKNIEPDRAYSAKSLADILSHTPHERPRFLLTEFFAPKMRFASAVGLTGFLMLLVAGGATVVRLFVPAGLTSLDPAGLRAEAQAIDMQVQLANLQYSEPGNGAKSAISGNLVRRVANVATNGENIASLATSSEGTSTQVLSIDEALDELSRQ